MSGATDDRFAVAILLIEAGAEIDAERMLVQELFWEAVREGKGTAVRRLVVEGGAWVWERSGDGRTAGEIAVGSARKVLTEFGAIVGGNKEQEKEHEERGSGLAIRSKETV